MQSYRKKKFFNKFWLKFKRTTIALVGIAIVTFIFKEVRVDAAPEYSPRVRRASFELESQKTPKTPRVPTVKTQTAVPKQPFR